MVPRKRKFAVAENCADPKKVKKDDDSSNWVKAVVDYIRETQTDMLDLASRGLGKEEVQSILTSLRDSKVTELNLEYNHLRNGMADVALLLINTKIKKLNVSEYIFKTKKEVRVTAEDLLQLLKGLKNSQIKDLSVSLCLGLKLNIIEARECISYLQKSKLVVLKSNFFEHFPPVKLAPFLQDYFNTSITCLDLTRSKLNLSDFLFLVTNLSLSSVTDLNLEKTGISPEALQELSERLVETKIEKLNLGWNKLKNAQLKVLAKGLVNSNVTDLDLKINRFSNLHPLFTKLKETRIRTLNLDSNSYLRHEKSVYRDCLRSSSLTSLDLTLCYISDEFGAGLMESLRFSNVTKLDIHGNDLGMLTVRKFAENVKDINLTDVDFNRLSLDAFFALGKCLKESKLTRISMGSTIPEWRLEVDDFLSFLKLTEGSPIRQIKMNFKSVWCRPLGEPKMLVNTAFTELNLCGNSINDNVSSLIPYLKFTSITHLNLAENKITDDGVMALAESLKETQIIRLNLDENLITSQGAKCLAFSLKDAHLLYLHLKGNKIHDDGLEFLAENAKGTFMSVLDVSKNSGRRVLLVDKVLWQNKVTIHKFVSIFKQIVPQTNNDDFCFDHNPDDLDVSAFLENCMWFYRTIVDKPCVISILLEDKDISLSREQIFKLVFEKFLRQFSDFIACRVEANVTEQVSILEKAEGMGLTAVVESLLLNRPVYTLDEGQGILHPLVYRLLLKYQQPICNLAVEPGGVTKIIEYFTEHATIEGAQDVINLLRDAQIL